jgi:hypothetical protein
MKNTCLVYIAIAFLSLLVSNCGHPRSPIHGVWVVDSLIIYNKDYSLLLNANMVIYNDDGSFICSSNRVNEDDEDTGCYELSKNNSLLTITINNQLYDDTYAVKILEKNDIGIISSMILQSRRKKIYLQKLP